MHGNQFGLRDRRWESTEDVSPWNDGKGGGRCEGRRTAVDRMPWVPHAGTGRRDLPGRYGPRQAAYGQLVKS